MRFLVSISFYRGDVLGILCNIKLRFTRGDNFPLASRGNNFTLRPSGSNRRFSCGASRRSSFQPIIFFLHFPGGRIFKINNLSFMSLLSLCNTESNNVCKGFFIRGKFFNIDNKLNFLLTSSHTRRMIRNIFFTFFP